jgi:hypothetical protein
MWYSYAIVPFAMFVGINFSYNAKRCKGRITADFAVKKYGGRRK